MVLDAEELDERAGVIVQEWNGIFAAYEAFYIHSILHTVLPIDAWSRLSDTTGIGMKMHRVRTK